LAEEDAVGYVKQKTVEVSAEDFLRDDVVCHAEFEHDGVHWLIQVERDYVESPRKDYGHVWMWATTRGAGYNDQGAMSLDDWDDMSNEELKQYLWAPLALYRHSEDVIYVGDGAHQYDPGGWDSGQMGVAYVTKSQAIAEWGKEGATRLTRRIKEAAFDRLKAEVKEMNAWLQGDVYGVTLTDLESEEETCSWGSYCFDREEIQQVVREMLPLGMTAEEEEAVLENLEWA
jgi:hypothetical protein